MSARGGRVTRDGHADIKKNCIKSTFQRYTFGIFAQESWMAKLWINV